VGKYGADVLVADVRNDLRAATFERVQAHGCLVAVIDDLGDRRLAADLAFYPPVPRAFELDWSEFGGTLHIGWNWIILRPQFGARRHPRVNIDDAAKVLIAMGGADPAGLSLKTLDVLSKLGGRVELHVVAGAANQDREALRERADARAGQITLHRNVDHMAGLMAGMDLAVAAFGVTAYELAALGVPSLYLCLTDEHASAATALGEVHAGDSLGLHSGVTAEDLRSAVVGLLDDPERRQLMQEAGPNLGLGQSTENVAQKIVETVRAARDGPKNA
jgi:spore coat polysaccharide biosynthesis protein SpsF